MLNLQLEKDLHGLRADDWPIHQNPEGRLLPSKTSSAPLSQVGVSRRGAPHGGVPTLVEAYTVSDADRDHDLVRSLSVDFNNRANLGVMSVQANLGVNSVGEMLAMLFAEAVEREAHGLGE